MYQQTLIREREQMLDRNAPTREEARP